MEGLIFGEWRPVALVRDMNRLVEILQVLVRHGFTPIVSRLRRGGAEWAKTVAGLNVPTDTTDMEAMGLPVRIRLVLQDLGPTFIKLGQILSTRSDLIPADIAAELTKLQDTVPPCSFAEVRAIIEADLKKPISEIFATFDEQPIGSASIGQVHCATLIEGDEVVVKVQRPGVRQIIERDLHLLAELADRLINILPELEAYELPKIVAEFRRALMRELDYTHERRNALRFASIFREKPAIVIPRIYSKISSERVLTMERIFGVKITEAASIGNDLSILAQIAIDATLTSVFEHGFFHADPHPGNIFTMPINRIAFLDLGMVGRLSDLMRFKLIDLVVALIENDADAVAYAVASIGKRQTSVDYSQLVADIAEVMDKIVGLPLEEIRFGEVLRDLFEGAQRHRLKMPPECFLMAKALLTVETVARELDPDMDIPGAFSPHIRRLIAIRFAPKRLGKLTWRKLSVTADALGELPEKAADLLDILQHGALTFRVEPTNCERTLAIVERIIQKLALAVIIGALLLGSAVFITFSGSKEILWGMPAPLFLGFAGYIAAIILIIFAMRRATNKNTGSNVK